MEIIVNIPVPFSVLKCRSCRESFVILYVPKNSDENEHDIWELAGHVDDPLYCPFCGKKELIATSEMSEESYTDVLKTN